MNTETKQMLTDLIQEILSTDEKMSPPPFKIDTGEVVLLEVKDDLIKKIYTLAAFYKKESSIAAVNAGFSPDDNEAVASHTRLEDKANMIMELFWFFTKEHYALWGEKKIGIRKDWKIVRRPDKPELPEFLKDLFGGLGGK